MKQTLNFLYGESIRKDIDAEHIKGSENWLKK